MYKRLLIFIITAILFFFIINAVVLADQDGNHRYCNTDQYGCWVTEEDGRRSYIIFWSEEAKNFFMGKDKRAIICDPPADNANAMKLHPAPEEAAPKQKPTPDPVPPKPDPTPVPPEPDPNPGPQPEPESER